MSEKQQSFKRSSNQKKPQSEEEESFQTFCKQMLKARVFRGCYQERRYVEHLNGYRDLIIVDKQENDLIKTLEYLRNRISDFYQNDSLWIGITLPNMIGTPAGVCMWTQITNIPLGKHWFYIKTLKFRNNEIEIKIQQVRSEDAEGSFSNTKAKIPKMRTSNESGNENDDNDNENIVTISDFIELFQSWKNSIKITIYTFLSRDINKENIITIMKFFSLLIVSLLAFMIEAVKFIGIYTLKFMTELRLWIHTCTPIILKLIELIAKLIGGIYILIAMFWRDMFKGTHNGSRNNVVVLPLPPNRPHYLAGTEHYRNLHSNYRGVNNRKVNYFS